LRRARNFTISLILTGTIRKKTQGWEGE